MTARSSAQIPLGNVPSADLLPEIDRLARNRRPVVRGLIRATVATALVMVLGVGAAVVFAVSAEERLEVERFRTADLVAQQSEFREVQEKDTIAKDTDGARAAVMTGEIDWNALLAEIRSVLPEGVALTAASGEVRALDVFGSAVSTLDSSDGEEPEPLRQDSIGSFRLTAVSPTVPEVEQWLARLESITGFAGIAPPVSVVEDEQGRYVVTIEVRLNMGAYLERFAVTPGTENEEN